MDEKPSIAFHCKLGFAVGIIRASQKSSVDAAVANAVAINEVIGGFVDVQPLCDQLLGKSMPKFNR
ncbi:MAG: hypothetical protein IPK19_31235 [Chloroflexi bacterium]|nr:hypothetical protein [Chloroflexota bacterium]